MPDSSVNLASLAGLADTRTTPGGDHRQVIVLGNDGDAVVGVEPFGALTVNSGFSTIFYDSWSGPLDTTDKWTVDGRGAAPSLSGGNMTMPATVSTYNALRSKDVIRPNVGFTYVANGLTLEAAVATGAGRFWGLGTPVTTPAPGALAQEGVGFEIDQATGALYAVTYTGGVRNIVATLTRPTDGLRHRYAFYFRVTGATWFIDNLQVPVASVTFPNIAVVELPALIVRQNAASFTGTPVFMNVAHLTADTSRQNSTLVDPFVGTRQQRVGTSGGAWIEEARAASATVNRVPASATSTTLAVANALRRGLLVMNESTATVYLKYGPTATSTSYTVSVPGGGYWEMPDPIYSGVLDAVWTAANGAAQVTETI